MVCVATVRTCRATINYLVATPLAYIRCNAGCVVQAVTLGSYHPKGEPCHSHLGVVVLFIADVGTDDTSVIRPGIEDRIIDPTAEPGELGIVLLGEYAVKYFFKQLSPD